MATSCESHIDRRSLHHEGGPRIRHEAHDELSLLGRWGETEVGEARP